MLNCQNEQKDKTSSPSGETLALLGQDNHQINGTLPLLGLQHHATRAKLANQSCHVPWKSSSINGDVLSIMVHVHLPGADPHKPKSTPNVLMRAYLFSSEYGLVINPVLPLPSQRPSDGLFSPMEVRTDHLPMCTDPLAPVRRAWSCTSKATPSRGSSVQNIMAM
jgi:hypothetical protein